MRIAREIEIVLAVDGIDIGAVLQPVCQPRHMRQQIDKAHGRSLCARGKRYGAAATCIDAQIAKFRNDLADGVFQRDLAVFHQLHESDRGDRLRHGRDPEDRIVPQGGAALSHPALGIVEYRLPVSRNDQLGHREAPVADIAAPQKFGDPAKPFGIETQRGRIGAGERCRHSFSPAWRLSALSNRPSIGCRIKHTRSGEMV